MVFVTRAVFPGDFAGDAGLAGADEKCREAATTSVHPDVAGRSFVAWVSTSEDGGSPSERFVRRKDLYVLPEGTPVAEGWNGLVSGQLKHAIDVDEHGANLSSSPEQTVWTGTSADGQSPANTPTCRSWSSAGMTSPSQNGWTGWWSAVSPAWSANAATDCSKEAHLYCFER